MPLASSQSGWLGSLINLLPAFARSAQTSPDLVLCSGLDGAGKTTLTWRAQSQKDKDRINWFIPNTQNPFAERVLVERLRMQFLVLDAHASVRWPEASLMSNIRGVIFVVDSSVSPVADEGYGAHLALHELIDLVLKTSSNRNLLPPVLVVCTKQDLPGARTSFEMSKLLDLNSSLASFQWACFAGGKLDEEVDMAPLEWLRFEMDQQARVIL